MDAHEPCVPVDDAPGVHRHADACPGDLAVAGPATELRRQLDHLRQAGGPERMAAADEATARIHDETGRVDAGVARLGGGTGITRSEEAERLEREELLGGGGIVQLEQVGVTGPEAEGFPRRVGGLRQPVVVVDRAVSWNAPPSR